MCVQYIFDVYFSGLNKLFIASTVSCLDSIDLLVKISPQLEVYFLSRKCEVFCVKPFVLSYALCLSVCEQ